MTDAELCLWRTLRQAFPDLHWRHQVPLGAYTADFCSHRAKLIVEADGGQHASEASQAHDEARTRFLEAQGYRVLRFWNHDVLAHIDGVVGAIASALAARAPRP
jgi:very-short-patch-repair endonuclease